MPETDIVKNFPLMASDDLTEEDKQNYMAVVYKSAFSKDMLREVDYLSDNVVLVANNNVPTDIPMYFFISLIRDGSLPGWKNALSGYLSQLSTGKKLELDADHYPHYGAAEIIATEAKLFLEQVK